MSIIYQKPPQSLAYVVGVENVVDYEVTNVLQTGVITNAVLHNVVLPAGAFANDGQRVKIFAQGSFAGNAGNKTFRLFANGTAFFVTAAINPGSAIGWALEANIFRRGSSLSGGVEFRHGYPTSVNTSGAITVIGGDFAPVVASINVEITFEIQVDIAAGGDSVAQNRMLLSIL